MAEPEVRLVEGRLLLDSFDRWVAKDDPDVEEYGLSIYSVDEIASLALAYGFAHGYASALHDEGLDGEDYDGPHAPPTTVDGRPGGDHFPLPTY